MSCFKGKVALVTGSSSGIGAETAIQLAKQGCHVTITGRNKQRLEGVKQKCEEAGKPHGVKVYACIGDITDSAHLKHLAESTLKELGPIDILVNNAGGFPEGVAGKQQSITDSPVNEYDGFMNTNMRSVLELTKLCIPSLKQTKGNVVNISSIASMLPSKFSPYYGMAKATVDYFTSMLATELGPHHVRVNAINPGPIKTGIMSNNIEMPKEAQDAMWALAANMTLTDTIGYPEDIAAAVLYLAGDSGRFITGINLVIDGGAVLKRTEMGAEKTMEERIEEGMKLMQTKK